MAPSNGSSEQSVISGILRRVDRQVRLNRVLDHLSIVVALVLATLVSLKIIGMLVPISVPAPLLIVSISTTAFLGFLLWSQYGARHLGQAAAVVDTRGDLHDEIKSAYWFMRQEHRTTWTDAQLARAALTARGLRPKGLVPTVVPQRFWGALGLGAILLFLSWVPAGPPLLSFTTALADPTRLTAEQEEQFEQIRSLMEQAQELEEAVDEADQLSADAQRRLEQAMRQIEADELSMEELLRELREAQNALQEGNLDIAAMQEALEDLARDLEGNTEFQDLAAAMQNQDLAEAAALMRQLAESLAKMDSQQLQEMSERLQQATQGDQQSMQDLMEALRQAAEAMSDEQTADAQQAMQEAADAMEAMSQRMGAQEMMNQASQQMQAMQQSLSQQQLAQQMQQLMSSEQSGAESQQGAMAMPSDEVQKTAGSGESGDPSDQQGGPAGHATSDAIEDAEMTLGQATTLQVQLEMELLSEPEDPLKPEEPPDPEDIFQEASRRETARVEYRSVRSPSSYAKGSALNVEQIPWRYRNLVKRYFLAIRPRENQ